MIINKKIYKNYLLTYRTLEELNLKVNRSSGITVPILFPDL